MPSASSATVAEDGREEVVELVIEAAADPVVEPEVAYAKFVSHLEDGSQPVSGGSYRATNFESLASQVEPQWFYEPSYDETLASLVAHVLACEGPIAESLLVQRIARVHGFQRAGRLIRDRVMRIVERRHLLDKEPGGGRFAWTDRASKEGWNSARAPAGPEDVRQIEEIPLAELRAARFGDDPVEIARGFGIRRLSAAARLRIERALALGIEAAS